MRKLFDAPYEAYRVSDPETTADAAPDEVAEGTPKVLLRDLVNHLGDEQIILSRPIDLIRFATDASPYRLFPKVVVLARTVEDIQLLFAYAHLNAIPITFRAAGTSLSGQAQGDGILVEVLRNWIGCTVEDGGRVLRSLPGTILSRANAALKPYGYRLGPDPGSKTAASIGGVIANNASGMCCGTVEDSYQTVRSLKIVLPSGTVVDTGAAGADEALAQAEPEIVAGLTEIRDAILADPQVGELIRSKYRIKNTTGYTMKAFLDGRTPVEILQRLMIGSEGTLGFIAEAVFDTVPDDKHLLTSLMIFPDMRAACDAVAPFVAAGAAAVELLDRASIRAVQGRPGVPDRWHHLPAAATALLVEFRDPSPEDSARSEAVAIDVLSGLTLLEPTDFTRDPRKAAAYWVIRNGLLASVGGARPTGSSFILEDVCFPPERLAEGALALQALFAKHKYEGVIFGHASAGNLHFLITPQLRQDVDIRHFDGFLRDVVDMITIDFAGSLKAEHGTGRNIAPFVEQEWGRAVTDLMRAVKLVIDPHGILSPGVVLSDDPDSHLDHLKSAPTIESVADRCIECGFCESVCPSRRVTTTPRQRIAVRREMMRQPSGSPVAESLARTYSFDAVETCAGDGMCAIACPVSINTGDLMKEFRVKAHNEPAERVALIIARRYRAMERMGRVAVRTAHRTRKVSGTDALVSGVTETGRVVVSHDVLPTWLPELPKAAPGKLPETAREGARAVYFPACINRIFGNPESLADRPALPSVFVALSMRAGVPVWIPPDVPGTCCGTVWHSKGYDRGNTYMANKVVDLLWKWTDSGELPIVVDASSCAYGLRHEVVPYLEDRAAARHGRMRVVDSVEWARAELLPRLQVRQKVGSALVHDTCSARHMGLTQALVDIAGALADEVTVPIYDTCCGMAGDRGMLHPSLVDTASVEQAAEIGDRTFDVCLSSNRTCEVGMTRAMGREYSSFLYLLESATR